MPMRGWVVVAVAIIAAWPSGRAASSLHFRLPSAIGGERLLVRLAPGADAGRSSRELAALGLQVVDRLGESPGFQGNGAADGVQRWILAIPPDSPLAPDAWAARLAAEPAVRYAVAESYPAMELRARQVPDDPLFSEQWTLDNRGLGAEESGTDGHDSGHGVAGSGGADIDAPEAWSITRGSPATIIAVLDDGVEISHPDLAPNVSPLGRDFTQLPSAAGAEPRASTDNHGTAVAGVAAARGDNALGISGACPLCTILPVRVYGSSNIATAAAFQYAVDAGADIIVNSWGYKRSADLDDAVRDAIELAATTGREGRGAVVVFGMTNEAVDNCSEPNLDISSLEAVIAVGVSDHDDRVGGSGFGPCMDLVAPAKPRFRSTRGVVTTDRSGNAGYSEDAYHRSFGGTSAAAPLVAGVAGLLLSLNPDLSGESVRRILEHSADKIDREHAAYDERGFSERAGWGRINARRALRPNVELRVEPKVVAVNEPFVLTITATAPFGIGPIAWRGRDTGSEYSDWTEDQSAGGASFHTRTWEGLKLSAPGTFRFEATLRDLGNAGGDAYPHVVTSANDDVDGLITVLPR
jgi:subtilisin family serine protease